MKCLVIAVFGGLLGVVSLSPTPQQPLLPLARHHSMEATITKQLSAFKWDPEMFMDVVDIIRYYGYPGEQHDVQTEDGYILTIQRVPPKDPSKKLQPVLLQHGLMGSSAVWVDNTLNYSLAFILAEAGYDVWLGNIRGNIFGRKHVSLSPKQKEFWMMSWGEMAQYDLPAMIDFVLNKTGFSQLHYIGHSMGTTMGFAMLSERPEYNEKVKCFYALAPSVTFLHATNPIRLLVPFRNNIKFISDMLGMYELNPNLKLLKFLTGAICTSPVKIVCDSIAFVLLGGTVDRFNVSHIPVFLAHLPAGASIQTILHYAQVIAAKKFIHYDHGATMNLKIYGQVDAPEYNVTKITSAVALFYGDSDNLASPGDVALLAPKLQNLVLKHRAPDSKFNHMDFMWALDGREMIFNKMISLMKKIWKE